MKENRINFLKLSGLNRKLGVFTTGITKVIAGMSGYP